LLFISGWLLVGFAVALAQGDQPGKRRLLILALAFVGTAGWAGIVARSHYATLHSFEPWAALADEAARMVERDAIVVTNSPSFQLEMNYALYARGLVPASSVPGWVRHSAVIDVEHWSAKGVPGKSRVVLVKGVTLVEAETRVAETWLRSEERRVGKESRAGGWRERSER